MNSQVHPIMQHALSAFAQHVTPRPESASERSERILGEIQGDDGFLVGAFRRVADEGMFYSLGLDCSECPEQLDALAKQQTNGSVKSALALLAVIGRGMAQEIDRELQRRCESHSRRSTL